MLKVQTECEHVEKLCVAHKIYIKIFFMFASKYASLAAAAE
jgi:hypothetical protein